MDFLRRITNACKKMFPRKCKSKNSQDDSNISIANEGKLNDNKKSSRTYDDSSTSTMHWINSKDDDGFNSKYSFKIANGD